MTVQDLAAYLGDPKFAGTYCAQVQMTLLVDGAASILLPLPVFSLSWTNTHYQLTPALDPDGGIRVDMIAPAIPATNTVTIQMALTGQPLGFVAGLRASGSAIIRDPGDGAGLAANNYYNHGGGRPDLHFGTQLRNKIESLDVTLVPIFKPVLRSRPGTTTGHFIRPG